MTAIIFYLVLFLVVFLLDHFRYAPNKKHRERSKKNGVNKHHNHTDKMVHVTSLED